MESIFGGAEMEHISFRSARIKICTIHDLQSSSPARSRTNWRPNAVPNYPCR